MDEITKKELDNYISLTPFFALSSKESDIEKNKFMDSYSSLPLSLKSILIGDATLKFLLSLGARFQIPKIKLEGLSRMIREVIMANMYIAYMPSAIADYLGIIPSAAKEIANSIVSELFAPALEDIKKIQREKFGGGEGRQEQSSPAPTATGSINQNNVIDLRNKDNQNQQ